MLEKIGLKRKGFIVFFCISFFLGIATPAYTQIFGTVLGNIYSLSGDIQLRYEKNWVSGGNKEQTFTHRYNLYLGGYVVDPRLFYYRIGGNYSEQIKNAVYGDKNSLNYYSYFADIRLLSRRPRRTFLRDIPQPINIYFRRYFSENTMALEARLSLTYKRDEKIRFFYKGRALSLYRKRFFLFGRKKKNEVGKYALPFPTFYFDYNLKKNSSETNEKKQNWSLRAATATKKLYIDSSYNVEKRGGDVNKDIRQKFELNLDYSPIKRRSKRLDILNRLVYKKEFGTRTTELQNTTNYKIYLDEKRTTYFSTLFAPRYLYVSNGNKYTTVNLTTNYAKIFNPNLNDTLSFYENYINGVNKSEHTERVVNLINYSFSKSMSLGNTLYLGHKTFGDSGGIEYGGSILVGFNTVIPVSTFYAYEHNELEHGQLDHHNVKLSLRGHIGRISFYQSNSYNYTINKSDNSFKNHSFRFTLGTSTYINRLNISLSGSHNIIKNIRENAETIKRHNTSIIFSTGMFLTRNMSLFFTGNYTFDNQQHRRLEIRPILNGYYRLVTFTLRYSLIRTVSEDTTSIEHKVFFTMTRRFSTIIRAR